MRATSAFARRGCLLGGEFGRKGGSSELAISLIELRPPTALTQMSPMECPNCYLRVILSLDGRCPACSRLPTDPAADPSRTKVTVWEGMEFPKLCFGCGSPTRTLMTVRRSSSSPAWRYCLIVLSALTLPVVMIVAPLRSLFAASLFQQGAYRVVRIRIPFCDSCQARKVPMRDRTDFHEGAISLVVPRSVAEHLPKE